MNNSKRQAFSTISENLPGRHHSTFRQIIENGVSILRGGHERWKYASVRICASDKPAGDVRRLYFEEKFGPIPEGRFLLNGCGVQGCITPECQYVSRYSAPHVHRRKTHNTPASDAGAVCNRLKITHGIITE